MLMMLVVDPPDLQGVSGTNLRSTTSYLTPLVEGSSVLIVGGIPSRERDNVFTKSLHK